MEQQISKEDLISSIFCLIKNLDKEAVIRKILDTLDTVALRELLQGLVDPLYETKREIYINPERLTKSGRFDV